MRRVGSSIKSKFTDTNDQVIDTYVQVRPEVIQALGRLARGGVSMDVRANAARAAGILRGSQAVPYLIETLPSKDSEVIHEYLFFPQKNANPENPPRLAFPLSPLNHISHIPAIQTT